ncbi:hypothetical protein Lepto7376_1517 [[Leptolyngbya] sp. PCC 7376]|uniref:DUF6602 domain-containing protein n=1 Tax=[Leptolyngbya] sp. PCC 7376 TaxID=111781 RepID=UPI00029F02D9|nr:DUF6602 domain-containing protein [[Leptolyngbya] sp. PCC 7376]AFY37860.1 hypothetical protein Lepto7376_1517 [[Leptolyngbya] sp. PCC 7376]
MTTISQLLNNIGSDLVTEFGRIKEADHPGEKGSIGETTSRQRLEKTLPQYIKVSTGFVLDSFSSKSRQMDIVLHESSCPSFDLGAGDDYSYFPCESVAAVGEVKTSLGKDELEDAYAKIESAKCLSRSLGRNSYRKYGSTAAIIADHSNCLDPSNIQFQTLGFILCGSLKVKPDTTLSHLVELDQTVDPHHRPSLLVSINQGIFARVRDNQIILDGYQCQQWAYVNFEADNFSYLVKTLTTHITNGTTIAEQPILRYLPQFNEFDAISMIDC